MYLQMVGNTGFISFIALLDLLMHGEAVFWVFTNF